MDNQNSTAKSVRGRVVSKSGDQSVRVVLDYKIKHPMYKKFINRRTKLGVHDETNQATVGDVVDIVECRPMSKTKSWKLTKIVQKADVE